MKVILIMVESLNGKITNGPADKLRWGGRADKLFFKELTQKIGTVIMGSGTFEAQNRKPLKDRHNIVVTSSPERYDETFADNLEFTSESPEQLISRLALSHDQVALLGGGKLNAEFLNQGLVSEMYVTVAPIIFAGAQEIFAGLGSSSTDLSLIEIKQLDDDTICLHYSVMPRAETTQA